MERELFGYERGAFTGANSSKKGLLEEADGGTIFLDDISAMDIKCQAKLLKVIEYGELKRVGGNKTRRVDVRFIASSNKDLKDETEKGRFRKDLYHRLTAFPIEVPPLRERKEDIPLLANYFLNKIVRELHRDTPVISGEAMKYLMEYSYPGNIRELKNMIERMVILSTDKVIDVEDLPLEIKMKSDTVENKTVVGVGPLKDILEQEIYSLADVEKVVIAIALQKTRWNKQETSKLLGIGRTTPLILFNPFIENFRRFLVFFIKIQPTIPPTGKATKGSIFMLNKGLKINKKIVIKGPMRELKIVGISPSISIKSSFSILLPFVFKVIVNKQVEIIPKIAGKYPASIKLVNGTWRASAAAIVFGLGETKFPAFTPPIIANKIHNLEKLVFLPICKPIGATVRAATSPKTPIPVSIKVDIVKATSDFLSPNILTIVSAIFPAAPDSISTPASTPAVIIRSKAELIPLAPFIIILTVSNIFNPLVIPPKRAPIIIP